MIKTYEAVILLVALSAYWVAAHYWYVNECRKMRPEPEQSELPKAITVTFSTETKDVTIPKGIRICTRDGHEFEIADSGHIPREDSRNG